MASHVRITDIFCRTYFATLQICELTAFDAIRRCQMVVSDPRNLCSRTRADLAAAALREFQYLFDCCMSQVCPCYMLCVGVLLNPSNCFVSVLHHVSHRCSNDCHACKFWCLLSFGLHCFLFLQVVLLETHLSISFQNVGGLICCIFGVVGVVVVVVSSLYSLSIVC